MTGDWESKWQLATSGLNRKLLFTTVQMCMRDDKANNFGPNFYHKFMSTTMT